MSVMVPYGLRSDTGDLIHCSTPRLDYDGVTIACPDCGGILIAKQGEFLRWHFAHALREDCDGGRAARESILHERVKYALAEGIRAGKIRLPKGAATGQVTVEDGRWMVYRADVGICPATVDETYTALEVWNTHRVGRVKRVDIGELQHLCFEIDVSRWHDVVLDAALQESDQPIWDKINEQGFRQVTFPKTRFYDDLLTEVLEMNWFDIQRLSYSDYVAHAKRAMVVRERQALHAQWEQAALDWGNALEIEDGDWERHVAERDAIEIIRRIEDEIGKFKSEAEQLGVEGQAIRDRIEGIEEERRAIGKLYRDIEDEISEIRRAIAKCERAIADLGECAGCPVCGREYDVSEHPFVVAVMAAFGPGRVSVRCVECR